MSVTGVPRPEREIALALQLAVGGLSDVRAMMRSLCGVLRQAIGVTHVGRGSLSVSASASTLSYSWFSSLADETLDDPRVHISRPCSPEELRRAAFLRDLTNLAEAATLQWLPPRDAWPLDIGTLSVVPIAQSEGPCAVFLAAFAPGITPGQAELDICQIAGLALRQAIELELMRADLREKQMILTLAQRAGKMMFFTREFSTGRTIWSDEYYEFLGYKPGSFPADRRIWLQHVHPEDRERIVAMAQVAHQYVGSRNNEYRMVTASGEVRWIETRGNTVADEQGRPCRSFGVLIDISERKAAEKRLLAAGQLEAVGQLASGVVHDINNLLTVITGNLELAQRRINDKEAITGLLRRTLEAAEVGAFFNQRLISLAQNRRSSFQGLSVNSCIERTMRLLGRLIGDHVSMEFALENSLWQVFSDPSEIDCALTNLVVNARDAMPRGGRVVIKTDNVQLGEADCKSYPESMPGEYVRLSVTDTGTGMSEDTRRRAMEPFFTTKGEGKGSGLGLSSVASSVRQMGGFVGIESEMGSGTTVSIYLPRHRNEIEQTASCLIDDAAPLGQGERILVVEDDLQVREVTAARLEALGYAVDLASSGLEAVRRLQSNDDFDLVFSDVVMPHGMSGFDLSRWIIANRPHIRMALNSGYNEGDRMSHTVRGLDHMRVLHKPYTRLQLAEFIHDALKQPLPFDAHSAKSQGRETRPAKT